MLNCEKNNLAVHQQHLHSFGQTMGKEIAYSILLYLEAFSRENPPFQHYW